MKKLSPLIILIVFLSACSSTGVKPWQRGYLARDDMSTNPNQLKSRLHDHVFFSKEAANGGSGSGGGGCGCN